MPQLVSCARHEELLGLEDSVAQLDDPFLAEALTMAIDGTGPEELRDILGADVSAETAA